MTYDIERDPGRAHSQAPQFSPIEWPQHQSEKLGTLAVFLSDRSYPLSQIEESHVPQEGDIGMEQTYQAKDPMTQRALKKPRILNRVEETGMSLQNAIREIALLQRALNDQALLINNFKSNNAETISIVKSELKGSEKGYDQQMLTSLARAEKSLQTSLDALQRACSALDRVRTI